MEKKNNLLKNVTNNLLYVSNGLCVNPFDLQHLLFLKLQEKNEKKKQIKRQINVYAFMLIKRINKCLLQRIDAFKEI